MIERRAAHARELLEQLSSDGGGGASLPDAVVAPALPPSDHLLHRADLAFLNRNWVWEIRERSKAPRRWFRAKVAGWIIRLFDRYLLDERAFVEALVRFQNDLARRSDQLSDEIRALAGADRALVDVVEQRLDRLERRIAALHGVLEARVERLESRVGADR